MTHLAALDGFASQLEELGWVTDLFVAGSLATGDYRLGVSDIDLVALVDGPLDEGRVDRLRALHRALDAGVAAGLGLGCVYVDVARLGDPEHRHPTWTHGSLIRRTISGITRAELNRCGYALFGRSPSKVIPALSPDDLREAVCVELHGYWRWAVRRPWLYLDPSLARLSLTSMARARHTLATGELITKSQALAQVEGPGWLRDQVTRVRRGERVRPRRLRTAWAAWRDARRTGGDAGR